MPPVFGTDTASAGAMTSANRIGVRSGTMISRGVWALNANRRRTRVNHAPARFARSTFGSVRTFSSRVGAVMVVMILSFRTSGRDAAAGEAQVHVVERGRPGRGRAHGGAEIGGSVDDVGCRAAT